jgi:hypothetical protein
MIDIGNTLINVDPPTGNRINGEIRDDVIPQDGTGTPIEDILGNDLYYSLIAIMNAAGVTADDSEEGALTSQVMNAVDKLLLGAPSRIKIISSANYTILDTDTFNIIFISTGASTRTITLPLLANNIGKRIKIYKTGGTGNVLIAPNASNPNTITSFLISSISLVKAGDSIELQNTTTFWADVNLKRFPLSYYVNDANYTIQDYDSYQTILVNSVSVRTITLPLLANNAGRRIKILKVSGASITTVAPNATDTNSLTNDGLASIDLARNGMFVELEANTSTGKWEAIDERVASQFRIDGYAGYGSVDNKIMQFTNVRDNYGNYFAENHSTGYNGGTEGLEITIQRSGKWSFTYTVTSTTITSSYRGLSLNSASLTVNVLSLAAAEVLVVQGAVDTTPGGLVTGVTWCGYLNKGDIIRPHTSGVVPPSADQNNFTAAYLGN